jgi:hypothetical protein
MDSARDVSMKSCITKQEYNLTLNGEEATTCNSIRPSVYISLQQSNSTLVAKTRCIGSVFIYLTEVQCKPFPSTGHKSFV